MSYHSAEMYANSMNTAVFPCENFYEYACANYPMYNDIQPYENVSVSFLTLRESVDKIILGYIKSINLLWPKGFQKVRTYYELCINEDHRRQDGYDTLEQELAIVGMQLLPPFHLKTEPRNDFAEILGRIHRFSVRASAFLYEVEVLPFERVMKLNTLIIGSVIQPHAQSNENEKIIPPEDQVFVKPDRTLIMSIINHLYDHFKYQLTKDMKKEITQRVDDILELESSLERMRQSFKIESIHQSTLYSKPSQVRAIINKILEGGEIQIDFFTYLEALFTGFTAPRIPSIKTILEIEDFPLMVTITQLEEFLKTYEILRNASSSVFESFIWWTIVKSILEEGPAELYEYFKGYNAVKQEMAGPPLPSPRTVQCMKEIKTYFGKFVGYALAKKTNGRKKKEKVTEMFENIKLSYEENIRRTHWSDDETKEATLAKIKSMKAFIGFDESVLESQIIDKEYGKIDSQAKNYYKLLVTLYRQEREKNLFKLLTINDFNIKPESNPADPSGTHYVREYNYIVVPITDIQFPFWDLGLEVLHYATMGFTLAHEVGHSIDATGSLYNAEGNMVHIMTDAAATAYDEIVSCFIEAYSKLFVYVPEQGFLPVNGKVSVDENMADWQGYNMALIAYKKYEEKHGIEQKLPNTLSKLNSAQLFSLAYSNQYCANARTKYLVLSTMEYDHAPERARVNGVLKNSIQFSDAYGCNANAPMNPPKKCEIWFWRV